MDTDCLLEQMTEINLSYFLDILSVKLKNDEIEKFVDLYKKDDYQTLFNISIEYDILEIVSFLYENYDVRFYLSDYISIMNKDLFEDLNSMEIFNNKFYRILIKNGNNRNQLPIVSVNSESYKYLLYNRRYSKIYKDDKGFYYIYNKK